MLHPPFMSRAFSGPPNCLQRHVLAREMIDKAKLHQIEEAHSAFGKVAVDDWTSATVVPAVKPSFQATIVRKPKQHCSLFQAVEPCKQRVTRGGRRSHRAEHIMSVWSPLGVTLRDPARAVPLTRRLGPRSSRQLIGRSGGDPG